MLCSKASFVCQNADPDGRDHLTMRQLHYILAVANNTLQAREKGHVVLDQVPGVSQDGQAVQKNWTKKDGTWMIWWYWLYILLVLDLVSFFWGTNLAHLCVLRDHGGATPGLPRRDRHSKSPGRWLGTVQGGVSWGQRTSAMDFWKTNLQANC